MINSHEWPYNGYGSTLGEWVSMIISQLGMALAGLSCILGDCKYWNILIVILVEYTSLSVMYCFLLEKMHLVCLQNCQNYKVYFSTFPNLSTILHNLGYII